MHYDFTAIPDAEVPVGVEPAFRHTVTTYASEVNKTVGVWRAVPDHLLEFKPRERANTIRAILVHQLLSERRFFAEFAGRSVKVTRQTRNGAIRVRAHILHGEVGEAVA